jgi:hypothetical protein
LLFPRFEICFPFHAPALPEQNSDGQIVRTYVTTWFYRFQIKKHYAGRQTWLGLLIHAHTYGKHSSMHEHYSLRFTVSSVMISLSILFKYLMLSPPTRPCKLDKSDRPEKYKLVIFSCAVLCRGSGEKLAEIEMRASTSCITACAVFSASSISRSYLLLVAAPNDARSFRLPPPVSCNCCSF